MTPQHNHGDHLDKLREVYEQSQRKSKSPKAKLHEDTTIGFPTDGNHVVRLFAGPDGKHSRKIIVHHNGRYHRTHCPDLFENKDPNKDYPKCQICLLEKQRNILKYRAKFLYMSYASLIETDNPKNYWCPGKVYIILMQEKLKEALNRMAQPFLDQERALWDAFLDPRLSSYATHISINRQISGFSNKMEPMFNKTLPPIELGDWYKPLSECWLPEEFNMSDYEQVLAAVKNGRI